MKKVLIIGANGFVGYHLANEFRDNNYLVYGADISEFNNKDKFDETIKIDILNENDICEILESIAPDYIINLAAISSVKQSWSKPVLTFDINVNGTINILESIRRLKLNTKILLIGSSEEYGKIDYSKPVTEKCELKSINPYGISKITQEKIANMYKEVYGIDVVLVRAFNHIGVGQKKGFVVPDFASQIVDIEKGKKQAKILVGNLAAERDFTDVRDVVKAYRLLLEKGKSGEVYNVGSGKTISIKNILDFMIKKSKVDVEIKIDENKFRKIETPKIQCDISKIKSVTGWTPIIPIKQSLCEILDDFRNNN